MPTPVLITHVTLAANSTTQTQSSDITGYDRVEPSPPLPGHPRRPPEQPRFPRAPVLHAPINGSVIGAHRPDVLAARLARKVPETYSYCWAIRTYWGRWGAKRDQDGSMSGRGFGAAGFWRWRCVAPFAGGSGKCEGR
jgi:hypothetical protein